MNTKKNMDIENDLFCEIVKDKLVNYTLPVDDDSWDKIAEHLSPVPRKKIERRWIAVVAVAASIALLLLLFSINNKIYHHETASLLPDHEETIVQVVSEEEIVQPTPPQTVEHSTIFRKSVSRERLAENDLATKVIPQKEIVEENPVVPTKEESSVTENPPVSPIYSLDFGDEKQIPATKRKKQRSLRLSFGSGGNLLAKNNTGILHVPNHAPEDSPFSEISIFRAAAQEDSKSRTEEILEYENYPDVTHHLPLSFGITVKKELNQTFAIESGIVYSYITSVFSREFPKSKADLQLHYIGIPLNIHTRLFGNRFSQWEMYLSAGGMVEKGFLSHFVQKIYFDGMDNYVKTVTSDEKIKGLQWSIGIAPGVDYRVHKNYSIYLEPKLSYYFDNNQPESARTKHPLVIGINAGVRYTW